MFRVYAIITDDYQSRTVTRVGRKAKRLESAQRELAKHAVGHITSDESGHEVCVEIRGVSKGTRRASGADPKGNYTQSSRKLARPELLAFA